MKGTITRGLALSTAILGAVVVSHDAVGGAERAVTHTAAPGDWRRLQLVLDTSRRDLGLPGASVSIARDGTVVWTGLSGWAVTRTNTPVTRRTLFSLASVTKTYVSTMVLRLMEAGRLRLEDPIAGYVPSYVPDGNIVTIKDLLGMTSGYPDVENTPAFTRWASDPNHRWSRDTLFRMIQPVRFRPGTRYEYCNTNYLLLGAVIEHASGASVGAEFQHLVLDPLGLRRTFFRRSEHAAEDFGHGYVRNPEGVRDVFAGARSVPTDIWGTLWTDGGIAATAGDVATFVDALYGGRVLQPATLALMEQPGPDGSYGLGTFTMTFGGHVWQGHDGEYKGYESYAFYDPARRLTIVAVTNLEPSGNAFPVEVLWRRVSQAIDHTSAGRRRPPDWPRSWSWSAGESPTRRLDVVGRSGEIRLSGRE